MKRAERRQLEKELRLLAMEELKLDPEHDAQMTEWVRAQYEQTTAAGATKPVRKKKTGRRILVVAATAVLLMVSSFMYTVFTPDAVSHAKSFIHRATVWVNDVLHLGLEIEVPPDTSLQGDDGVIVFYSLEEAAAALPHPLVYLKHPDVEFQSITIRNTYQISTTAIVYRYESIDFDITMTPIGNDYSTRLNDLDSQLIPWEEGDIACWDFDTYQRAVTYYADKEILINTKHGMAYDTFIELCQSLAVFN